TLLYQVTNRPYRELYEIAIAWPATQREQLLSVALGNRKRREDLPRHFRTAPYVFDFIMDIGAYRDLHRHRRCQQFRQQYTNQLGYDTPALVTKCGAADIYESALQAADKGIAQLPHPAAQYLLPFGA